MKRFVVVALGCALLAWAWGGAAAQYVDDEETEDHRRQDEEYLKRYLKKDEQPAPPGDADAAELAAALLAQADELIRDKNYRSVDGERYRIQTDDPRVDLDSVETLLQHFRGYFDRSWADRTPGQTYDEQGRFFLFYSFHKYNQLLGGDWSRQLVRPKGHYGSLFDAVVIHTDSDRPGGLANTLVHESAHQLVDRIVYGGTARPSLWVAEGLATYYENTFMNAEGEFEDGVIGGKRIAVLRDEPSKARGEARLRIRNAQEALEVARNEDRPLILEIISADDPSQFYGRDATIHYDLAWLLVHFLFHGDDGAHADAFVRYLRREADDGGGVDAFLGDVGLSPAELDAGVVRHLKSLKVR